MGHDAKIQELEDELSTTKYNKRTQHHVGLIKAKIAHLKEKDEQTSRGKKQGEGFAVKKTGDATVVLIGFPSVGKSTLLNQITNAESKVAAYDFTTLNVIPGLLAYQNSKIQVLDIPGIIRGASEGKGRGKEVFSVLRAADLLIIIIDVNHPGHLKVIQEELRAIGLRMNERQPDVRITKTTKGGVNLILGTKLTKMEPRTVKAMLNEFRVSNADVLIRQDIDEDDFIDVIEANKIYVPALIVINKIDTVSPEKLEQIKIAIKPDLCISADKGIGMDALKELVFVRLQLRRIYCKQPGTEADMSVPLILRGDITLQDVCTKLHRDFAKRFRFARIWGSSKFPGMRVQRLDYRLKDKDIVELHLL